MNRESFGSPWHSVRKSSRSSPEGTGGHAGLSVLSLDEFLGPSFSIVRELLSGKEARGDVLEAGIYLGDTDSDIQFVICVHPVYSLWYALLREPTDLTRHHTSLLYGGSSEPGLRISDSVIAWVIKSIRYTTGELDSIITLPFNVYSWRSVHVHAAPLSDINTWRLIVYNNFLPWNLRACHLCKCIFSLGKWLINC